MKHLRITSDFNQKEFAELLEIPQSSYSDMENSKVKPKQEIQNKIISNFNLPQDYFLECYFEKKERKRRKIKVKNTKPWHWFLVRGGSKSSIKGQGKILKMSQYE